MLKFSQLSQGPYIAFSLKCLLNLLFYRFPPFLSSFPIVYLLKKPGCFPTFWVFLTVSPMVAFNHAPSPMFPVNYEFDPIQVEVFHNNVSWVALCTIQQ